MTDLRQAAQWALQYLESNADSDSDWEIITALKDALEQQAEPAAWTPVAEALPKSGEKVLACYRHRWFNLRPIRAFWTAAKTEEADSDDARMEYDAATDAYYVPEGWYECIDNWGDYSSVAVTDGEVTHWMPLPQPPIEAAHNIKEQL